MTINERIIAALNYGEPVKPDKYTGTATTYFTFNYATNGDDYADDAPEHEKYFIQVHFVCPLSYDSVARCKDIKQKISAAGFTWPAWIPANDDKAQHIVFEFEDVEGV